ncbi:putative B3 domain-containing protein [Capsicum annuum]|nr:putative B3 domain-containing protein [Capsicum annuum]
MANHSNTNSYEEERRQRVLENKKRFEDLGILNISKNLSDLTKSEKKSDYKTELRRGRQKTYDVYMSEPRRSSRARNPVSSYRDEIDDIELPSLRKRSKFGSSWASYLARPLEEVKVASFEERAQALKSAEKLHSNLQSGNPYFIKSMVRSHVYSCFWLGLPTRFCEDHLPKSTVDVVLVNEEGLEYEALFIGKRTGLSGGWRAFALDHKLDDGDALIFELIEPTKFKVYIVRASHCSNEVDKSAAEKEESEAEEASTNVTKKRKETSNKSKVSTVAKEEVYIVRASHRSSGVDKSGAEKEASEAEEASTNATKKRKKTSNKSKIPTVAKEESEAEEASTNATKKRKKTSNKSKVPTVAKEKEPVKASATRRSTRRK